MIKRSSAAVLTTLTLSHASTSPLYRQLYDGLRRLILTKQLLPGSRLPSVRRLVSELGVSRNTILNAFDQLIAEGYLEPKHGSGTYIAEVLPDERLTVPVNSKSPSLPNQGGRSLSRRGAQLAAVPKMPLPPATSSAERPRAFLATIPDIDAFPRAIWGRFLAKCWRRASYADLLAYQDRAGYPPLRQAIAAYLGTSRGVRCSAEQVIIVAGSQQGIDLTARILLDSGDGVWLADPGYLGAYGAFAGAGAQINPVPVDSEGFNVEIAMARYPQARLAFVMPSHQFPLGVTMSLRRRLALLEWADRANGWILEDDYDSEYRYTGRPLAALQGLDRKNRVIYLGTFSKVLFPALRLGYVVVPPDLIDAFTAALSFTTMQPPILEQMALADFMIEGHFSRHVRRMRALYGERQAVLVEAACRELRGLLDIQAADAGMHLLGWLPDQLVDTEVATHLAGRGIDTHPLSSYSFKSGAGGALLLGYTALQEWEIKEGVQKLARALQQFAPR